MKEQDYDAIQQDLWENAEEAEKLDTAYQKEFNIVNFLIGAKAAYGSLYKQGILDKQEMENIETRLNRVLIGWTHHKEPWTKDSLHKLV